MKKLPVCKLLNRLLFILCLTLSPYAYAAPLVTTSTYFWDYDSELLKAIQSEDLALVKMILKNNDIAFKNECLNAAIYQGNLKIIKLLVNAEFPLSDDSLFCAIAGEKEKTEVVKYLIGVGAKVDVMDEYFCTPLIDAVMQNRIASMRALFAGKADLELGEGLKGTPLIQAVKHHNVEAAKALIKQGARLDARDRKSLTPIMWAALFRDYEMAELLDRAGADLQTMTTKDAHVKFSLCFAKGSKSADIARQLRNPAVQKAVADAGRMEWALEDCEQPLFFAAMNNDCESIKALIASGADIHDADVMGMTALGYAIVNQHVEAVQLLIDAGAALEGRYFYGFTPLLLATLTGSQPVIECLLKAGADPDARTFEDGFFKTKEVLFIPLGSTIADIEKIWENPQFGGKSVELAQDPMVEEFPICQKPGEVPLELMHEQCGE